MSEKMLGLRNSIMAFSGLIVVGGIILTVSAVFGIYWLGLIGRCFCGVGVECQNVTFYALIALWFTSAEHGTASAVSATTMRIGMVLSGIVTPIV